LPVKRAPKQYLYESTTCNSYWFCSKAQGGEARVAQRSKIFVHKSSSANRSEKKWW
jgi:hypothetical protein